MAQSKKKINQHGMQNDTATLEGSLIVSYKAKLLQYDPAKELFIIYPKQLKTCVYKKLKHSCS